MRRLTTIVGLAVLIAAASAYTGFWWVAADKIKAGAIEWAQSVRQQKIDVSWQTIRVAGYPLSFRLELGGVAVHDGAMSPAGDFRAPNVSASIRPWDFHVVSLTVPDGLKVTLGPEGARTARLTADSGTGAVAVGSDGGATIWFTLHETKTYFGTEVAARTADGWIILPVREPAAHTESGPAIAALLRGVVVPVAVPGLAKMIDDLGFALTVKGAFPNGPARQAAAAWRDAGGTVELDSFHLRWGDLVVNGSGTLALDGDLQPMGGFSGGIAGFDQLLGALAAAGRIKENDARIARMALAMLARTGANGQPELSTSLTIQNGQVFLGPAKLGPAPRINW
jgi:hypothetical protein